jgi:ribosomal protein S18 acetylase RimI-like enzyme
MAKGCVYIPKTGKDAGKVFGSKDSLAAHMNYTPAMADMMAKYEKTGGNMDVAGVTKWLTENGYIKAEAAKPTTKKTEPVFNTDIKTNFNPSENLLFNQGGLDNLQTQIGVDPDIKDKYVQSKGVSTAAGRRKTLSNNLTDALRKIGRVFEGDKVDLRDMSEQAIIDYANTLDEIAIKNERFGGKRATITKSSNFGRDVEEFDGRIIGYGSFGVRIITDDGAIIEGKKFSEYTPKAETKKKTTSEKKPTVKKAFPKAPVTDVVKAALKSVDNTTAAIMNLAKVLPSVYESLAKQVKLSIGKPASQQISEAYHNAVENGVEPGLVAAVENAVALQEQLKSKPSLSGQIETNETLEMEGVPTGTRAGNKASMDALERKHSDNATKKAVIAAVKKAARTLKSVFPSMDIHIHEDPKQYAAAMAGLNGQKNSKGNFSYTTSNDGTIVGRIDINLSTATPSTVVHEVTHAILLKMFGDNSAAFLDFRNKIEKIISTSGNKRLSDFADQYQEIADEFGQAEEYLTELSAILSDKETPISYGVVRRIAELINKAVSFVTLDKFQPFQDLQDQKDTLEFFNTMAQKIKTGQEFDINSMGLHGEIKATGIKSKSSISSGEIMGFEVNPNAKVEDDVPLSRFNGKVTNLIESDRMVGGYIADKEGSPIFKFYGGVKFPEITGKWWASRTNSKAKGIAQNANKNRDKDGYVYSSPMIGSEKQHMSNADMMFTTIELMKEDVKNKKSKVTKGDVVEIMDKALDRKKIADKRDAFKSFFAAKNVVDMFDELEFILFQEGIEDPNAVKPAKGEKKEKEKKYLVDRNGKIMLTEEGEKKIPVFSFEDRLTIVQTLLGDPKVKEPRFPMAGSITDTARRFTEPVAGRAEKIGDIVMVMRTKGTLKHKKTPTTDEFYHRSYPYEIYAVNEDGTPAKVEVFFLDGAYSMQDVLPDLKKSNGDMFSYKEYAEKHAAKTQAYVEAQYNRTAKLAYASGKIKSKSQLFGETGATRMENAEKVLGNLQVARDMEAKFEKEERTMAFVAPSKSAENAQKIRLATGWERGADGMWKLEIPDGQLNPIDLDNMYKDGGVPKAYLDEIYDSKELYDAYPTAKDIRVSFVDSDDFKGAYNHGKNEIELAINNFEEPIDLLSTLLHEIQHHIQYAEGFATGSNTDSVANQALSEINKIGKQIEAVKQEMREPGANLIKLRDKQSELENKSKKLNQQISKLIKDAQSKMKVELKGPAEIKAFVDLALKDTDVKKEMYIRAAGEVESRNVQKRMGLSEEERMNKLLSSTEDVRRNDQLVLGAALRGETPALKSKAQLVTLEPIDFENESDNIDVYEASSVAEKIAKDNGVNILRGKDLKSVALNEDGDVVGGLWTEVSGDEFSFDVAVDKSMQGKGVGEKLVNEAISEFNTENYEGQLKYSVDVTNPVMEKLLSKYGFEVVKRIPGHAMMEHPTNNPKIKSKAQVDAYHGTGYEFDRFSAEKIGTGEGAQAFGWGLYFTDVKEIANEYAKKISFKNTVDNFLKEIGAEGATYRVWNEIISYMPEEAKGEWLMEAIDQNYYDTFREEEVDQLRKFAEYKIKNNNKLPVSKNVYSVILHQGKSPDQYTWLEWDKPLTDKQKNQIKNRAKEEGVDISNVDLDGDGESVYTQLGQHWYFNVDKKINYNKEASLFLLRAGIDGVKYPAESISRGTTSQTARGFNYVVFDENAVTIKMRSKAQLADGNAKKVADLYTEMREGGGWAERQKINAILDGDPKLSYIYHNFREITQMLEDAQLLTKSGNCP